MFKKGNQIRKGRKPVNAFPKGYIPWNKKPLLEFVCKNCNSVFYRHHWIVKQNKGKADFCSLKCKSSYWDANFPGDKNPNWVGGKMTYRGRDWTKQREKVIKRSNGSCEICGKFIGKSLPVHHKKPYRNGRINHLSNLIGVCQSCHMKLEYKHLKPFHQINQVAFVLRHPFGLSQ